MPKVTRQTCSLTLWICTLLVCHSQVVGEVPKGPAETLYEQLRTVGLDDSRVYKIREASLDRASIHISLNDGTIAFTGDVAGKITGAFFYGDGEVLLSPPSQIERSAMALFTGATILEEKFGSAYFRFNDDVFKELEPALRTDENSKAFAAQWNENAQHMAEDDALRLLTTFSRTSPDKNVRAVADPDDHMLHARVQGLKLGVFDLFFDSEAREQISAGQVRRVHDATIYDVWTSFAANTKSPHLATSEIAGEAEDRGDIEVLRYKITAEIKPPTEFRGEAQLDIGIHNGGSRCALFELSRYLKIREVLADGFPVEFIHNPSLEGTQLERRGDDLVAVVFPEPLRAGQKLQLHFSYGGPVLSAAGGGLLYVGARGNWYPNRGFSKAVFDLGFKYPLGWTLVATGKRTNIPTSALGQTSRWVSEVPIPVAGFNLGKYSRITKHAGPVTVNVYAASAMENDFPKVTTQEFSLEPPVFPRHRDVPTFSAPLPLSPAGNAQAVSDEAARAVTFFAERFGAYPYTELSVTQMPGSISQGWPGLIFLSSFSFLSSDQKAALHMTPLQQSASDEVIAHEAAHQWWGDSVVWSSYRDQWIVEALANYSSLLLLESTNPAKFRALMEKYRDDLLRKNDHGLRIMDAGPVTLGARLNSAEFPNGYETIAYERGTWLFHMLRSVMRDSGQSAATRGRGSRGSVNEPFLLALRDVKERFQTKPVSSWQLLQVFEEHLPASGRHEGKKSLDWFYQGWINGSAIPALELHGLKYSDKATSTVVSGTVKQKDAPEDLITYVPLVAALGGKNILIGRVFADGPETTFHLDAPKGTRKILMDPDQTILLRSR